MLEEVFTAAFRKIDACGDRGTLWSNLKKCLKIFLGF